MFVAHQKTTQQGRKMQKKSEKQKFCCLSGFALRRGKCTSFFRIAGVVFVVSTFFFSLCISTTHTRKTTKSRTQEKEKPLEEEEDENDDQDAKETF